MIEELKSSLVLPGVTQLVDGLSLVDRGGLTGSDRPPWFISDRHVADILLTESLQTPHQLLRDGVLTVSGVVLFEGFAQAEDGA